MSKLKEVSVVICTYTEERWEDLVRAVESVQRQSIPPREIIVVVDHNSRLQERICRQLPTVTAIENRGLPGASSARNSGVEAANGRIIAFLDDDAAAAPNWIEALISGYHQPGVLGVGGEVVPVWQKNRPKWFPEEFNWVVGASYPGLPETAAPVRNLWTVNMSVEREIFEAIQGFRTGFGKVGKISSPEDTDFCIRALQYRPQGIWLYRPEARVMHTVPASRATLKYFLRRCFNEGVGKAQLSDLVGPGDGTISERSYVKNILPAGIAADLEDVLFRRDVTGLGRAGAILLGLAATVAGYAGEWVRKSFRPARGNG